MHSVSWENLIQIKLMEINIIRVYSMSTNKKVGGDIFDFVIVMLTFGDRVTW